MLVVAAYECRSISGTAADRETFDNARMNWTAAIELALAVMITQMDLFNRLLGTVPLKAGQFGLAFASRGAADRAVGGREARRAQTAIPRAMIDGGRLASCRHAGPPADPH